MKTVYKPWGKEEWLELNNFYCYKRIYINAGHKTSLQYHNKKHETNYIISGSAEIWLENELGVIEKQVMHTGEYYNVSPPRKHRVIALTDLVMQEVSTPEVDDVIRIEDDTNRPDGKIDSEHKTPAVLILCAGLGARLHKLTEHINKTLLPINNKAILSHIIESFPIEYEFIIALGYKGDAIREYCEVVYTDRKITFVQVDDYLSKVSGPGYSALCAKAHLQRPFYVIMGDCLVDDIIPPLDVNWIGIDETGYPEKYSTILCDDNNNIVEFKNKSSNGFNKAFIGLAAIKDYEIFWQELTTNIVNGELVCAFQNPHSFPILKAKKLNWLDTGNIDDYNKAVKHFKNSQLSLSKDSAQISYKVQNKFVKFIGNDETLVKLKKRYQHLKEIAPEDIVIGKHFLCYPWVEGNNLYDNISSDNFAKLLDFVKDNVVVERTIGSFEIETFYKKKTNERVNQFIAKFGEKYYKNSWTVNGKPLLSMKEILSNISYKQLQYNPMYSKFHGDLHFANIIQDKKEKFVYIDWRTDFANNTDLGDLYYDLAKLLGGIHIPYDNMKDDEKIKFLEGESFVNFTIPTGPNVLKQYERWLQTNNHPQVVIRFIMAIIFLNMSPLHEENFAKLLWFKSLELLNEYQYKN